jgi:tetratricopeptide (TPR) repeat protein
MLFVITNFVVLVPAALVSWWLSSHDTKVTGANEREDFIRRAIRCGLSLILVELSFLSLWHYYRTGDQASGMAYLIFSLPLGLLWCSCLGELASHVFHELVDPQDRRQFDPHKTRRDLDMLRRLIQGGRREEAIQLCQMLKESGDVSIATLETMMERIGVKPNNVPRLKPLPHAGRLRSEGKLSEAEAILNSLLAQNPANVEAALLLMRLYAQDRRRADQAGEVLRAIERQPNVARAHVEFARRSLEEWSHPRAKEVVAEPQPESVDELIASGYFGTAIEILEQKTGEQPQDFELWLKLAGTHARHCGNIVRAEKIVQQIEANPAFSPTQIQQARAKLLEWREAKPVAVG